MAFIIINVLSEMDFAYLNPTQSQRIHHSKVSGWKVNFADWFSWPSWMYADNVSCPKLPSCQQSRICSRTPLDYESPKKVHSRENIKVGVLNT